MLHKSYYLRKHSKGLIITDTIQKRFEWISVNTPQQSAAAEFSSPVDMRIGHTGTCSSFGKSFGSFFRIRNYKTHKS